MCRLNDAAHRDAVRHLVTAENLSLVYLQETKLASISDFLLMQNVGSSFDYAYLPANGSRGGALVAWKASTWSFTNVNHRTFSLSGRLKLLTDDSAMWLTVVYGPPKEREKIVFLEELHELSRIRHGPWILVGDFNLYLPHPGQEQ